MKGKTRPPIRGAPGVQLALGIRFLDEEPKAMDGWTSLPQDPRSEEPGGREAAGRAQAGLGTRLLPVITLREKNAA